MIAKIILSDWVFFLLLLLACGNFFVAAGSEEILQPYGTLGLVFALCCIAWCVARIIAASRGRSRHEPR
jgi:succinate-acetate transporter protein